MSVTYRSIAVRLIQIDAESPNTLQRVLYLLYKSLHMTIADIPPLLLL